MRFDAEATPPSARRPRTFPVPKTDLKVVADDFSPNLVRDQRFVASEGPAARPAVRLKLSSNMVGQSVDFPLSLSDDQSSESDFFGLARISLHPSLAQPSSTAPHETRMVFAHYAPITHSEESPSDVIVRLSEDGSKVTILSAEGSGATYLRSEIMNRPVDRSERNCFGGELLAGFRHESGRPETKSDSPNNPAALVRISKLSQPGDAKPSLELAPAEDGIAYQLRRGEQVTASGKAKVGESFALGWADWKAEVVQSLAKC